jgi:hypothetical protein
MPLSSSQASHHRGARETLWFLWLGLRRVFGLMSDFRNVYESPPAETDLSLIDEASYFLFASSASLISMRRPRFASAGGACIAISSTPFLNNA